MWDEKSQFKFYAVSENDVRKVILNINEKKVNGTGKIPAEILKECVHSYFFILTKIIDTSLERGSFPN